jgi:hypothetical protein
MQKSKELFINDGASHIQTYWKSEHASQAMVVYFVNIIIVNLLDYHNCIF